MEMDMMTEEKKKICESIPITELSRIVYSLSWGIPTDAEPLHAETDRTPLSRVPWQDLRYLHIDANPLNYQNAGLKPGAYLNAEKSFLLSIGTPKSGFQQLINKCSTQLRTLNVWNYPYEHLDVSSLSGLKQLSLHRANTLTGLYGLNKLSQLNSLSLQKCTLLTIPPILHQLSHLTKLDLCGCDQLTKLILPDCESLKDLTVSGCKHITDLDLSGCSNLEQLNLSGSNRLRVLDLSYCNRLPGFLGLGDLIHLVSLDLSNSGITQIPEEISKLHSLRLLNLCELHLKSLPNWLPDIAEQFYTDTLGFYSNAVFSGFNTKKAIVGFADTTVDGVDMSIFNQPYEMVCQWFKERKQALNEIKVVFLGDGEAGKSHTIARLLEDGNYPNPQKFDGQSTPGIVIQNKEYHLDGRNIQVHYWDFGGQEILHSMHRIFLTNRTMYVILLNARDDTQNDRARYWLHNVKSFAPTAPVLLVLNKIDQNPKASVNETDLRSRYENLTQIIRLCAKNYTPEEFNWEFTRILLEEIQKTGFLDASWPISWTKVKEELESMDTHYILGDEYQRICEKHQVHERQTDLLHWFNDLGISFCFCDEDDYTLKNHVILRPDWITNALYIILFNVCKGAKNGLIPHKSIYELLEKASIDPTIRCTLPQAKYSRPGDISFVLGVMRKFHLSFTDGMENEFIPMLCQRNSTLDIQYYHKDSDILEFNMEFDYLPDNLLHRLMVERKQELDLDNVWRTGAKFQIPDLGYSAVIVIDGKVLRFFIRHTTSMHRPNTYLTMLKANVDRIWKKMGLKAPENKLVYKVDRNRAEFDYERLLKMQARGAKEEYCKEMDEFFPIADIINQSAPDRLDDERKLLGYIRKSCVNIQSDMHYRGSEEDDRNTRMRDDLRYVGYIVHDQTRQGTSASGKRAGELDLEIRRDNNEPWAIIEALRIHNSAKTTWNDHLDKLLDRYNPHGLPVLYLITFADCDKKHFTSIWDGYRNAHIQHYSSGNFSYVNDSFQVINDTPANFLKIARCKYSCGGSKFNVYHIFVQMDPE